MYIGPKIEFLMLVGLRPVKCQPLKGGTKMSTTQRRDKNVDHISTQTFMKQNYIFARNLFQVRVIK